MIAVCIYAVFKYLLPVLFPFVLVYGIAYILAKPVRRIAGESRWKRAFFSILLSAVFFITVGGLAVWLGVWLFSGAKQIIAFLPTVFQDFVFPFLEDGFAWIEGLFILADPSGVELLEGSFENILTALSSGIISLSNAALSVVAGAATKIPGVFMRTVITIQKIEIYFNFIGEYIPPTMAEKEPTPEELEEIRKKEARKRQERTDCTRII